eukprot:tig00001178_g7390.t1
MDGMHSDPTENAVGAVFDGKLFYYGGAMANGTASAALYYANLVSASPSWVAVFHNGGSRLSAGAWVCGPLFVIVGGRDYGLAPPYEAPAIFADLAPFDEAAPSLSFSAAGATVQAGVSLMSDIMQSSVAQASASGSCAAYLIGFKTAGGDFVQDVLRAYANRDAEGRGLHVGAPDAPAAVEVTAVGADYMRRNATFGVTFGPQNGHWVSAAVVSCSCTPACTAEKRGSFYVPPGSTYANVTLAALDAGLAYDCAVHLESFAGASNATAAAQFSIAQDRPDRPIAAAPTDLVGMTHATVNVTMSPDGGAAITGIIVSCAAAAGGGDAWGGSATGSFAAGSWYSFMVTGLTVNTTYTCTANATNSVGISDNAIVSFTTRSLIRLTTRRLGATGFVVRRAASVVFRDAAGSLKVVSSGGWTGPLSIPLPAPPTTLPSAADASAHVSDQVWTYDVASDSWTKMNVTQPYKSIGSACVWDEYQQIYCTGVHPQSMFTLNPRSTCIL